jgi:hypothetical protein
VTAAARFGTAASLPGIVYAAVANRPMFGGKLKTYNFAAASENAGSSRPNW